MTDTETETAAEDMAAALPRVQITMKPNLTGEMLLNGVDISNEIKGFQLSYAAAERIPELLLELHPRNAIESRYEGYARVAIAEPGEIGPDVARFLAAVHPGELEKAALNHPDLAAQGDNGLTKMMLHILTEWANGRS